MAPFPTFPKELEIFADRSKLGERLKGDNPAKIHELVTQDLLRSDPELQRLLGQKPLERIEALLSQGYGEPVLRDIVSGPLDADKLRDSYYCGVKYGIYDLQQLHRELLDFPDPPSGARHLAITHDGVHALEQFVLAKHYLTAQVYTHRVRLITDNMVVRSIVLGVDDDEIDDMRNLYSYDGEEKFVKNYGGWDDARFMLTFGDEKLKGKYCNEMVLRLAERRLLKQVFLGKLTGLPRSCREAVESITKPKNRARRRALEQSLADIVQTAGVRLTTDLVDPSKFVIVNSYKGKAVREMSRNDEGPILVRRDNDAPTTFENESDLFRSLSGEPTEARFAVYAPVEYENPTQRRDLQKTLRDPILKALEEFGNAE